MLKKVYVVLTVLCGVMLVNSGLNKFFFYMPMPENMPEEIMKVFGAFMTIKWLMPLVAIAEITGGILIAVPKTRALGAIVIFPVMTGIVVQHLTHDLAGIGLGLAIFLINVWVIIKNKEKYLPMVK